ncbi:unnamed protein product [Citrullus colocynthis]|uniref:Uncharacterized protein n=1 Tax=Citrullus colocynthis TaxID=252529 RepID=A0ABP0XMI8_9ROSI
MAMVGIIMGELGLPFFAFSRGLSTKIDEETVSPHRRTRIFFQGVALSTGIKFTDMELGGWCGGPTMADSPL